MDDLLEEVKTFICIDCEKVFTAESGTMGFCEACFKPEKREEVKQRPLYN